MGILDDTIDDVAKPATAEPEPVKAAPAVAETPADEAPLVSRDERCDSIDPTTGMLTAEAVELRRQKAEAGE